MHLSLFHTSHDPTQAHPEPLRDWRRLIVAFFIGLLLLAFGGYALAQYMRAVEDAPAGESVATIKTFTEAALEAEVARIKAQEETFNHLRATKPVVVDPSR